MLNEEVKAVKDNGGEAVARSQVSPINHDYPPTPPFHQYCNREQQSSVTVGTTPVKLGTHTPWVPPMNL